MESSRSRQELRFVLAPALGAGAACIWLACGARTALDVPVVPTAPVEDAADAGAPRSDAGVIGPTCVDGGCLATACGAPTPAPGSVLWQARLPALGDGGTFSGPLAADPSGWTYFLGWVGRYPATYTLLAVDACGAVRWQADGVPTGYINDEQASVLVTGDRVIVQVGAMDAFDRTTGAHLWNVSLQAIATDAGDGMLALDDGAEIGPTVASADGTSFVELETVVGSWLLSISPQGAVSKLAPLRDGTVTDMVIDADGDVDLLFNSAEGALVRSYTRSGTLLSSGTFGCAESFLGPLASGRSFLLMQTAGCALSFQGSQVFSLGSAEQRALGFGAMVIDADDNIYATGQGLDSFDATGQQRWMATPTEQVIGGPLLGGGGNVFVVESATGSSTDTSLALVAIEMATGAVAWRTRFTGQEAPLGPFAVLLTAAGQLVYASNGGVTGVAAGQGPSLDAEWATPHGGPDQRRSAAGQ